MRELLSVLIGYLIGSISPAYFLGRLIRRTDLREHGTKNLGTVNTAKVLGIAPAIIPAVYDTLKGVIVVYVAEKIGVSPLFAYLSGIFAIVGHVFPFYLRFHGGQGVATATGLLIRNLTLLYLHEGLRMAPLLLLSALLFLVLAICWITSGQGKVIGVVVLPVLPYLFIRHYHLNLDTFFSCLIIAHILSINILNIKQEKSLSLKPETRSVIKFWRFALRPVALLFLIFYEYLSKNFVLLLIGAVSICFLTFDIIRLAHSKVNFFIFRNLVSLFKQKEERQFSSMTLFLVAYTLTILLFDKAIAYTVITFLIFGDMFAKFFGLQYGRRKLFNKTVEGTLAYFASCIVAGLIVSEHFPISSHSSVSPALLVLIGAGVSALIEVLPIGVDDNLSVALVTSVVLWVLRRHI